jgi:transcriptional regulator with XRE-family HTH domain
MLSVNEILKQKREALGIDEVKISHLTGLSVYEYGDLEAYPNEFFDQISLGEAKRVCQVLQIDIKSLLPGCVESDNPQPRVIHRNVLVTQERERIGLTREQLANQIGYETVAIDQVEAEEGYLDSMSPSAILDIARVLKINPCL